MDSGGVVNINTNRQLCHLALLALCLLPAGCGLLSAENPSEEDRKVADAMRKTETNRSEIPGANVAGLLDHVKLRDTIEEEVNQGKSKIRVVDNAFGLDLEDAFTPLQSAKAIKTVRSLHLNGFPLTDEMLEPLKVLKLEEITVKWAKLTNLQALRRMTSLNTVDVSGDKISRKGLLVLANLPNLKKIILSETPVGEEDLRVLTRARQLKVVILSSCPNIDAGAVARLHKARPTCDFVWYKPGDQNTFERRQNDAAEFLE